MMNSAWPPGDGEMARRIRTHDWAATPLGPIEGWPQSQKTAVGVMLASGYAMQLAWGPERIVLYNDAYAPMLGNRHPSALGTPFHEAWPEIWAEIEPLVTRVFAGETVKFEDMPLVMTRHGHPEDTWWNFSYSPVWDESGAVAGLLNVTVDATGRIRADRAEAALRKSEDRFRALVTASAHMLYRMSPDWGHMYQLAGRDMLTDTATPVERWADLYLLPDDQPMVFAAIEQAIRNRSLFEMEHRVRNADGSIGWVLSRAVPILDEHGEIAEWFGADTDITERKLGEQAVRESEERLRTALSIGTVGVMFWSDGGILKKTNDAFLRMAGFTREEALEKSWNELTPPEFRQRSAEFVAEVLATGGGMPYEKQYFRKDGSRWWGLFTARKLSEGFVEFVLDVSARREAEAALRESEARFRRAISVPKVGVLFSNLAGHMQDANAAFQQMCGYTIEELRSSTHWDHLTAPAFLEITSHHARNLAERGDAPPYEKEMIRKDGTRWWGLFAPTRLGGNGPESECVEFVIDITDTKRAEVALRESEARLRALVEGIPQLVWRAGHKGDWTWASPQWTAYTAQPEPDSHGQGWLAAVHPADRAALLAGWRDAPASGAVRVDHRLFHAGEGRYRWVQAQALPVRDDRGRIVEWLGTTTDVEELRRVHEQELFIAELQHRGRNLLTVVGSIADQMLATSGSLEEFGAQFEQRLASIGRVQGLLSREMAARVSLSELVRLELAAHGADDEGGRVALEGPEVVLPSGAVQMLALALHELLTNALKHGALAAPEGRLTITWSERHDTCGRRLCLDWRESGVVLPDDVSARRRGFGLDLIEHSLSYELDAETVVAFGSDGLRCSIALPLDDGPGAGSKAVA